MLRYPLIDINNPLLDHDSPLYSAETPTYISSLVSTNLPFLIEKDKWTPVLTIEESDVIPINFKQREQQDSQIDYLKRLGVKPHQLLLIMHIWDDCDTYDWTSLYHHFKEKLNNSGTGYRCLLVHNNHNLFKNSMNSDESIYYNHMWNRQKAYYTDFERVNPIHKVYTFTNKKEGWNLNPIRKSENAKVFMCPNRIFPFISPRLAYRKVIKLLLENENGYLSDPTNQKFLMTEEAELLDSWKEHNNYGGGHWCPIANSLYENSFISIFSETIVTNGSWYIQNPWRAISEKSYDPLIKGHFILPFAYSGIIDDLKKMGFRFPDIINYSYDTITDDNFRFAAFCEEAKRLVRIPVEKWYVFFEKEKELLEHNRQVFFNRPYDPLYEKVIKHL